MTITQLIKELINFKSLIVYPVKYFYDLAQKPRLAPAVTALMITAIMFSITGILADRTNLPYLEPPMITIDHYRVWLALFSPLVYGAGWLLCAGFYYAYFRLFNQKPSYIYLLQLIGPALFIPLLIMGLPTDLALATGIFNYEMTGFTGLWIRHLIPLLTFLYMLFMLWLMTWQSFNLLIREAFAIAMLSLLPTLYFWSLLLR